MTGATCFADQAAYETLGPCTALSPPQSIDSLGGTVTVEPIPSDGKVVLPAQSMQVGVEILPAMAEVTVDLEVLSPSGLSWSKYFEFSPFEIAVPSEESGMWRARAKVTEPSGTISIRTWSFNVKAQSGGMGCAIGAISHDPLVVVLAVLYLQIRLHRRLRRTASS
jgi:hypothetical protein